MPTRATFALSILIVIASCARDTDKAGPVGPVGPVGPSRPTGGADISTDSDFRPKSLAGAVSRGEIKGKERRPSGNTVLLLPHEQMPEAPDRPAARTRDEAVARTLDDLTSPNPHSRFIATKDAGALRLAEAVPDLTRLLRKGEPTAAPAIGSLGKIGGDDAARALHRAYRKLGDPALDLYILQALGETRSRIAMKTLVSALRSDQIRCRIAAARALGHLGMADATPRLRRLLEGTDAPPALRVAAASSLAALGSDECLDELERAVARGGPDLQREAIIGLTTFVASRSAPGDEHSQARRGGAVRIIASALGSPYPQAWRASLQALASMKPLDAMPVIEALERGSPEIAARAKLAKAAFGGAGAQDSIRQALANPEMHLRAAACDVVAHLADGALVDDMAHALRDARSIVRLAAVNALAELGGETAMRELASAAQGDDAAFRVACHGALAKLRARGQMSLRPRHAAAPAIGDDAPLTLERVMAGANGEMFCVLRNSGGKIELLRQGETSVDGYRVAIIDSNSGRTARVVITKAHETITLEVAKEPADRE